MKVEVEILELTKDLWKSLDVLRTAAVARNWDLAWSMCIECDSIFSEIRTLVRDRVIQEAGDDGK